MAKKATGHEKRRRTARYKASRICPEFENRVVMLGWRYDLRALDLAVTDGALSLTR